MKFLLFLCTILVVSTAGAGPLVVLVRHAEKAEPAAGEPQLRDPELSPAGLARAQSLADTVRDLGLRAVFATEYKRTQQTAKAVADRLHTDVTVVAARDTEALIAKLKALEGNALVVAHSNTVGEILAALGVTERTKIGESNYDDLFIVSTEGAPRVLHLHYR